MLKYTRYQINRYFISTDDLMTPLIILSTSIKIRAIDTVYEFIMVYISVIQHYWSTISSHLAHSKFVRLYLYKPDVIPGSHNPPPIS